MHPKALSARRAYLDVVANFEASGVISPFSVCYAAPGAPGGESYSPLEPARETGYHKGAVWCLLRRLESSQAAPTPITYVCE
jgi:hypothetical protein